MSEQLGMIRFGGNIYSLGFKVVTEDLKSLGLRKNPNIITYEPGVWHYLSQDKIKPGKDDFGGIWAARSISGAKMLRKYMRNHYSQKTRIFRAALDNILYANSYRVKTNGINLVEEILIQ
ncbi:MAG: hypothetical protein WCK90_04735 [archaeon]